MNRRTRLFLLGAAGAVVLAAVGLWLREQEWPKQQRLVREGVPVQALVTAKGVGAPDNVHYTYSAEDGLHSGVGRAGLGTPAFEDLSVDDEVLVFYAKSDPDLSTLGDPREHLRSNNRVLAVIILAAGPALIWALMRELRKQS